MARDSERIWDLVFDETIRYIESKADGKDVRDPFVLDLRRNYAKEMSARKYNNSNMDKLVKLVFNNLKEIDNELGRSGDRELDIIQAGVEAMVDGHFAELVFSNRDLERDLPQQAARGMEDAIRLASKIAGAGRRDNHDTRDDRDRNGGGGSSWTQRDDRDRDDRGNRSSRTESRPASRQTSRDSREKDAGDHWSILGDIGNDASEVDDRDERKPERDSRPREEEREYEHPAEPIRHEESNYSQVNGPDHTRAEPYNDYWLDDEHWKVAHQSNWKLTGNGDELISTVPTFYDINEYIKYYVLDSSGEVREELVQVSEENKHLAHTLREEPTNSELPKSSTGGGISLKALREGVTNDSQTEAKSDKKLGDLIKLIPLEQVSLQNVLTADSITTAVFQGRIRLNADDSAARMDVQFLRTPVAVKSAYQLDLVGKINHAATLTQAADLLEELKPEFEKPVFEMLNQRFGDNMLRAAKYQFQFDEVKQMNFSKHYGRFLAAFAKFRNPAEAAQFAQRVGHVTTLSTSHMLAEELDEQAGDLWVGIDRAQAVIFIDVLAVVSFDATIDELGIGRALKQVDTGLAVTQSSNRDLYQTLRELYTKLESTVPPGLKPRLLLSTSDNRLIEVLPYAVRLESFILAAV